MRQRQNQRVFIGKPQPIAAKLFGSLHAVVAHKIGVFNAQIAGVNADFFVHTRRFVLAQFAHVAHHKHARRGQLGEHIQRCFHAVGVGVVGVVQNQRLADAVFALQPPFDVAERG